MSLLPKKTLAIFSLTSCEGCQFEFLNSFETFGEVLSYYEIKNFRLGQEDNVLGKFDVAIIEGSPDSDEQIDLLRKVRKDSKVVIAIGSCAQFGGIQSQRNRLPNDIFGKDNTKSVLDLIKTNYVIPGCPINHKELIQCLIDIYYGKKFNLPDLAVCFKCKQNENPCLIKKGKPCLGPITRDGCNSICVNRGEACFGCRGPIEQANFDKIKEVLLPLLGEEELANWLTIYGDYEKEHKKLLKRYNNE